MYDTILVATDGSDGAREAIDHALELAVAVDATLYGLAVVDARTAYDETVLDPSEVTARRREAMDRALADLERAADAVGVSLETDRRTGVPREEILAVADERGADLVVLGARGRSSLRRALLGSTVDAVVRLSSLPVLVVGGDDAVAEGDDSTADTDGRTTG